MLLWPPGYPESLSSASSSLMHPIDVMKRRHISGMDWRVPFHHSTGGGEWIKQVFVQYTKGMTLTWARIVPHFIISMTVTAQIRNKV